MGLVGSGDSDSEVGGERGFETSKGVREDCRSIGGNTPSDGTFRRGIGVTDLESGGVMTAPSRVVCESSGSETTVVGSEAYPSISLLSAFTPPWPSGRAIL